MIPDKKKHTGHFYRYVLGLIIFVIHFIPFYVLIGMAFKSPLDTSSRLVMPGYLYPDNFLQVLRYGNLGIAFRNTIIITAATVLLEVIVGGLAAYPMARCRDRSGKVIQMLVMGVMMVPPLSILVAIYSTMAKLNGISTYWGIVVIQLTFGLPMTIYLFSNFIKTIPTALDEAASLDGCSPARTFFSVILPQLKPVIATVVILNGVSVWNDYYFSLYLLQKPQMKTIPLVISGFFSSSNSAINLNAAAAAALLCILPVILLYLLLQKYFIQGMLDSAVK